MADATTAPARGINRLARLGALVLGALALTAGPASAAPRVRTLPLPGGATRVVQWGTHGSPIVLVHGFVESADAFDRLAPLLARGHRVYAYDVRGFGWSARGAPYGDAPDRRQLAELIGALHLHRPVLVGH